MIHKNIKLMFKIARKTQPNMETEGKGFVLYKLLNSAG